MTSGRPRQTPTNKEERKNETKMCRYLANVSAVLLFLTFGSAFYLVMSFTPLTKQEHAEQHNKLNEEVEPFRKNLTECGRQVRASTLDVEHFLKRVPQQTSQGKCFVACMLKRNSIIRNNKVDKATLMRINTEVYGEDSEVLPRMEAAVTDCSKNVADIFEICEYASTFNDCMHMKMEHVLDKLTMERRMQALGQMDSEPDNFDDYDEDDSFMQMMRDEL